MLTESQLQLWREMAAREGLGDEYDYHLSMVAPPLSYGFWKMKFASLEAIQRRSDYEELSNNSPIIKRETALCNELGY